MWSQYDRSCSLFEHQGLLMFRNACLGQINFVSPSCLTGVGVIAPRFLAFCKKQFRFCLPLVARLAIDLSPTLPVACLWASLELVSLLWFAFWCSGTEEFGLVYGFGCLYFPPLVSPLSPLASLLVSTGLSPTSVVLGTEDFGFVSPLSPA